MERIKYRATIGGADKRKHVIFSDQYSSVDPMSSLSIFFDRLAKTKEPYRLDRLATYDKNGNEIFILVSYSSHSFLIFN